MSQLKTTSKTTAPGNAAIMLDLTCFELDQLDRLAAKYGSDRQGVLLALARLSQYIDACDEVACYLEGYFGSPSGQLLLDPGSRAITPPKKEGCEINQEAA